MPLANYDLELSLYFYFFCFDNGLKRGILKILLSTKRNYSGAHNLRKKLTVVQQPGDLVILEQNVPVSRNALDL